MRRKSLAEERPELLSQWDRNNTLSPFDVSCGSHKKVWWICDKGHKWQATVKNRALIGSGCPYCEHRAVLKGYNDLLTVNPKLAGTWSPNNTLEPSDVSPSSNTVVRWVCENGHEWSARVADRSEGHGCPYCAGHKVWKGFNDLTTTHPDLLLEWSEKNTISPKSITYKYRAMVWWHCSKCGGNYQAGVYAKTQGRVCPLCIANEIKELRNQRIAKIKAAKDFTYLLPQLSAIYYAGKRQIKIRIDTDPNFGLPVTAYMPGIRLIIDVCNSKKESRIKEYMCRVNNITYISMPERLPETESISRVLKAFSSAHIYLNSNPIEDLEKIRENYYRWKDEH